MNLLPHIILPKESLNNTPGETSLQGGLIEIKNIYVLGSDFLELLLALLYRKNIYTFILFLLPDISTAVAPISIRSMFLIMVGHLISDD